MNVSSAAFGHGQPIPARHTCDGENVNPPLEFFDIPAGAQSLALVVEDPDAPGKTFIHWLVWNVPPETAEIDERAADPNAIAGTNDFGEIGYGGPCPPEGEERHYFFRLYALDTLLDLQPGSTFDALTKTMAGHIVAQCELMGTYKRSVQAWV